MRQTEDYSTHELVKLGNTWAEMARAMAEEIAEIRYGERQGQGRDAQAVIDEYYKQVIGKE